MISPTPFEASLVTFASFLHLKTKPLHVIHIYNIDIY